MGWTGLDGGAIGKSGVGLYMVGRGVGWVRSSVYGVWT